MKTDNPLAGVLADAIYKKRRLLLGPDGLSNLAGILKRELRRHKAEIAVHVQGGMFLEAFAHNLGQKARLFVVDHDGVGHVFNHDDVNIDASHEIEPETQDYFLNLGIAAALGAPAMEAANDE